MAGSWHVMNQGVADGWVRSEPGATAGVTGVAVPTLNGVLVTSEEADPEIVTGMLDQIQAAGLPYCLQGRPALMGLMTALAASRGMTRDEPDTPLMVRDTAEPVSRSHSHAGLEMRELAPEDAHLHAEVAAEGFGAPVEHFLQLIKPSMLEVPEVRAYVAEVDGRAVTTGMGVRVGPSIAVFNIGTPPAYRRQGYAAQITARIVADGLASGARWSWLQSSAEGFGIYEGLGFRTIESWPCWVTSDG
jgi:ribosomal protein S18 acetylase RimI-like enzyme